MPQVKLDAALALVHRDILQECKGPIYLWCDSSPQLGTDWLLSVYDFISQQRVTECFQKAQTLTLSASAFQDACLAQDTDLLETLVQARVAASRFLHNHVRRRRQMPMAVGSGAATMADKVKSMALKFHHEAHDIQTLRKVAAQVQSFTVDLGVESGLAQAAGDVEDYLPTWMKLAADILPDEGLEIPAVGAEQKTSWVFPNSLLSAGLDHISNNLQADLDEHLQGWQTWLPGFKALAHLLSHKYLMKRLVARCVAGTAYAAVARCFETAVQSVAKWRWGTIVKTLPAILDLLRPLSLVWNPDKFLGRTQEVDAEAAHDGDESGVKGEPLDVESVTAAVRSDDWKVYGQMLLRLHEIGNFMSSWGSGCPCHEWLLASDESGRNRQAETLHATLRSLSMPENSDGLPRTCILAGKRAPELASGKWKTCLQALVEKVRPQVLMDSFSLPAEGRERILNDFEHGVSYITMVLDIKLAHWAELPWQLCSLATDVAEDRPKAARTILESFQSLPQHEDAHHRLTWKFLQPDSKLREQLQLLKDDAGGRF